MSSPAAAPSLRLAAVAASVLLALTGCGESTVPSAETQVRRALCAVDNLQSSGPTLGRASAPATLTGYLRLDAMSLDPLISSDLPLIIARYVRSGRLRIQLRTLATGNPTTDDSWTLAKIAQGAGLLGDKFWEALAIVGPTYIGAFQPEDGADLARQLGTKAKALETAAENPRVLRAIDRANRLAKAEGLRSGDFVLRTPVGRTQRIRYGGHGTLAAAIRNALGPQRGSPPPCSRPFPIATRSPLDEPNVVPGSGVVTQQGSERPPRLRLLPARNSQPRQVRAAPRPTPTQASPTPTLPIASQPQPPVVAPAAPAVRPELTVTTRPRQKAGESQHPKPSAPSSQPGRQPPPS
jgi:hypothetical protein